MCTEFQLATENLPHGQAPRLAGAELESWRADPRVASPPPRRGSERGGRGREGGRGRGQGARSETEAGDGKLRGARGRYGRADGPRRTERGGRGPARAAARAPRKGSRRTIQTPSRLPQAVRPEANPGAAGEQARREPPARVSLLPPPHGPRARGTARARGGVRRALAAAGQGKPSPRGAWLYPSSPGPPFRRPRSLRGPTGGSASADTRVAPASIAVAAACPSRRLRPLAAPWPSSERHRGPSSPPRGTGQTQTPTTSPQPPSPLEARTVAASPRHRPRRTRGDAGST